MDTLLTPPALQDKLALLARSLGHAHRLNLLDQLLQDEASVETLAQRLDLSIANASQHLQHLKRAHLVETRRAGKFVFYRVAPGPVFELLSALRALGLFQTQQIQSLLSGHEDAEAGLIGITRSELLTQLQDGDITLLDVRPCEEYAQGHLPGAINIPLAELEARLNEVPTDTPIIAYCRGPYCKLSLAAVEALRQSGRSAKRLTTGYDAF